MGINLLAEDSESKREVEQGTSKEPNNKIKFKYICSQWYKDIVHYLCFLSCPSSLDRTKYKSLRVKAQKYVMIARNLYWIDPVGVLFIYLTEEETIKIVNEYHGCICGHHYSWKVTTHKILKVGFFWPSLFSDIYRFVRSCEKFHIFANKKKFAPLPLIHIFVEGPFR